MDIEIPKMHRHRGYGIFKIENYLRMKIHASGIHRTTSTLPTYFTMDSDVPKHCIFTVDMWHLQD